MHLFNKSGIPTKPEVDKLMTLLEHYTDEQIVPYSEIEKVTGPRRNERAAGIIAAFKKRAFRERNVLLVAVVNQGYRIAEPKSRIENATRHSVIGRRHIVKASVIAGATSDKGLTEQEKAQKTHIATLPGRLRLMELCQPKD